MMKNIYSFKPYKDIVLNPLARWLRQRRISANCITVTGLLSGITAAACLAMQRNALAVYFLGLSIFMDLLDGAVARLEPAGTYFGKILDGVSDRIVEVAWVTALIIGGNLCPWTAALLPAGSLMLLGCRIWAYQCGIDSSPIRVTRFERMTAMIGVVILPWHIAAVILYSAVALGTFGSCFQIIGAVLKRQALITLAQ
jgi:phosphatidylglycerophosphate synthase